MWNTPDNLPQPPGVPPLVPPTVPGVPPGTPQPGTPAPYTLLPGITDQFASVFYPGAKIVNGQLQGGNLGPDLKKSADFLNSLWDPYSKGDFQKFFETYRGPGAASNPTVLKSLLGPLATLGWKGNPNAAGEITDFTLPDGTIVDPLNKGGAGGWQWLVNGPGGTGGPPGVIPPFAPPTRHPYPTLPTFTPPTFAPPSVNDALNDPGYKFRLNQGEDALQAWAAARGTLNDSGTAKGLIDYGQNAASQEYRNVWDRSFQAFGKNYQSWLDSIVNPQELDYKTRFDAIQHDNDMDYQNYWNRWKYGADLYTS